VSHRIPTFPNPTYPSISRSGRVGVKRGDRAADECAEVGLSRARHPSAIATQSASYPQGRPGRNRDGTVIARRRRAVATGQGPSGDAGRWWTARLWWPRLAGRSQTGLTQIHDA